METNYYANLCLRDEAIVQVLLSTGCQIQEVCEINAGDIDLEKCEGTIQSKEKSRKIFFPMHVAEILKEYLINHPTNQDALFLSEAGNRITAIDLNEIIQKLYIASNYLTPKINYQ
ncbi:MAG: hypothetical protein APF81_09080 [Desulfosporosinus sp. BRH_c37]|nr:MAG: hypothetical protein APF81_09080 [Desulfosporosinus sp. BRH_c37]